MSAFVVSKQHIDALLSTAVNGVTGASRLSGDWHRMYIGSKEVTELTAGDIGEMLWRENCLSVAARYPGDEEGEYPRYTFAFRAVVRLLSPVAALKLIDCYEYQSCEHDGWDISEAKRFCTMLKGRLISSLPGYDAAEWTV